MAGEVSQERFELGDGQVSARDGPDGRDGDEGEYGGDGDPQDLPDESAAGGGAAGDAGEHRERDGEDDPGCRCPMSPGSGSLRRPIGRVVR